MYTPPQNKPQKSKSKRIGKYTIQQLLKMYDLVLVSTL